MCAKEIEQSIALLDEWIKQKGVGTKIDDGTDLSKQQIDELEEYMIQRGYLKKMEGRDICVLTNKILMFLKERGQ